MTTAFINALVGFDTNTRMGVVPRSFFQPMQMEIELTEEIILEMMQGCTRFGRFLIETKMPLVSKLVEAKARPELHASLSKNPRIRAIYGRVRWKPYYLDFMVHATRKQMMEYETCREIRRDISVDSIKRYTEMTRMYAPAIYSHNVIKWLREELAELRGEFEC